MHSEALKSLPYLVHTNRELGLMLEGIKPLARFSYFRGSEPACILRYYRMFDRYVAAGRIVKRVVTKEWAVEKLPYTHSDDVYYTLPGQEWRVDAMLALWAEAGD